jgi:aromatic ring-opening dioxygenase catalytic subunit (LigB family)
MADLVGVFASSHAPLMARAWEAVDAPRRESITATFAELGRRYTAARPDVVVVVTPDHWVNFFLDNLPSVCIGIGETHERPPEPWLDHLPYESALGHPEFGLHLARAALAQGFEPSLSHHLSLDHGSVIPLWKMGVDPLPALVPVIVNAIEPPLPSLRRCLAWGDLLGSAIESYPGNLRVAVLATGGVSHSIGEADMGRIDEPFDRDCFEAFRAAGREGLLRFMESRLGSAGNGAAEMRNWLVAHGAAGAEGFELLGYHPYPEWYVGCGFAAWDLRGRSKGPQ